MVYVRFADAEFTFNKTVAVAGNGSPVANLFSIV